MTKSTARIVTCALSNHLDKFHVGLPSSYLEALELMLVAGKYDEVFTFFESRLDTAVKESDVYDQEFKTQHLKY